MSIPLKSMSVVGISTPGTERHWLKKYKVAMAMVGGNGFPALM